MFKKQEPSLLEKEIARVHKVLEELDPNSKEYQDVLGRLVVLYHQKPKRETVFSGDALLGAAVNLLGLGAVLGHERAHVITSKAFSWIKPLGMKTKS